MSPTHGLTNALDILVLVHDGMFIKEDTTMDHAQPDSFKKTLQIFRAVQDKLDNVQADDSNGELDMSRQLGQRRAGLPTTMAEEGLKEVFMEQGAAGPSTTIKYEAGTGPFPLEADESAIMSSLDSQLNDVAAHLKYPFWRYQKALHDAPILLPDPITDRGTPRGANYVAFDIEKHDEEPTIYSTMGMETGRDRHSVPKIQHYCRPFTQPTLYPSARSHNAVRYRQVKCSDTNEGEDIDELAE